MSVVWVVGVQPAENAPPLLRREASPALGCRGWTGFPSRVLAAALGTRSVEEGDSRVPGLGEPLQGTDSRITWNPTVFRMRKEEFFAAASESALFYR